MQKPGVLASYDGDFGLGQQEAELQSQLRTQKYMESAYLRSSQATELRQRLELEQLLRAEMPPDEAAQVVARKDLRYFHHPRNGSLPRNRPHGTGVAAGAGGVGGLNARSLSNLSSAGPMRVAARGGRAGSHAGS